VIGCDVVLNVYLTVTFKLLTVGPNLINSFYPRDL